MAGGSNIRLLSNTINSRGLVFSALLVCLFCSAAFGQPWDGNGIEGDPYQIWTPNDMQAIGADNSFWDAHFKLMADIDLGAYTGTSFNVIGASYSNSFKGVFDGNGHNISNFTYSSSGANYIGVFGYINDPNAEIRNLGLVSADVNAGPGEAVSTLAGRLGFGTICNCYARGGTVSAYRAAGGLVGANEGTIINCYVTTSVSGNYKIGGLVGQSSGEILYCYSAGSVSGADDVGGLLGIKHSGSTTSYSFWDIETSGQTISAGGIGKTTAEMRTASTFKTWGCDGAWTIAEGVDYPRLWWENALGEPIQTEAYSGGCGTSENPYLISTAEQMNAIGAYLEDWDKHFKLTADIDLSSYTGTAFNIIGNKTTKFTGVFDGNGHTISNFTYTSTGTDNIGLFGYVNGPNAEVKNLVINNPNISAGTSGKHVGPLVGYLKSGKISGCGIDGGTVSGAAYLCTAPPNSLRAFVAEGNSVFGIHENDTLDHAVNDSPQLISLPGNLFLCYPNPEISVL